MKFWLFACAALFGYSDPELECLWNCLSSFQEPTIADYEQIEHYLAFGRRPYLDLLRRNPIVPKRLEQMQNLKLIGPNGEMPYFQIQKGKDAQKCILIYASYNRIYPQKAKKLFEEVLVSGFDGDVLLRIGGFPNLLHGGLKLCHIPYAFKVAFLKEASLLNYRKILWLDTAMHPVTDFREIFENIERQGVFFTEVGTLRENNPYHLKETSEFLGVAVDLHGQIPHLSSAIIGLDLKNPKAVQFLDEWLFETEKVFPNLNWFPEELCLSIVAWRSGLLPYRSFGDLVCNENELFELVHLNQKPGLSFYLDSER